MGHLRRLRCDEGTQEKLQRREIFRTSQGYHGGLSALRQETCPKRAKFTMVESRHERAALNEEAPGTAG